MKKIILSLLAIMLIVTAGCGKTGNTETSTKELNIFTWADYIPGDVIADFEAETGIKVNYSNFSTNEEMLSKLQATKGGQYDIIVCSDYIIDVMRKEGGLIQELDWGKIPNHVNIDPNFQGKYYDPDNKYAIPYAAGGAMLIYNPARVSFEITSYRDLWNEELKDSIVVLDGARDIIGMTLQMLGYSINETDPAKLAEAKEELMQLKPNIIGFDADKPHEFLISGQASVGYMFGSQATAAMEAVPTLKFVYPKEGIGFAVDNFVLTNNPPNKDNAYLFMDYILQGEASAKASSIINYINCNTAAKPFLPKSYLDNETVNIPAEVLGKAQLYQDIGEAAVDYNTIWTEFKSK